MDILSIGNILDEKYGAAFEGEPGNRLSKTDPNVFSAEERESIIDNIYNGTYDANNPDPRLVEKTKNFLERRLQIGYGRGFMDQLEAEDSKTLKSLKDNLDEFARAKARVQTKALREQMFSGSFKRSRDGIKTDTRAVFDKYNEKYLKAEGNVTEKQAKVAKNWQNMKKKKVKFLRYTAVLDDRTRPDHRSLDGTVKPFDDDFWDSHTPPLGYNCRCRLESLNKMPVGRPREEKNLPDADNEIFSRNPARSRKIFPKTKHPYFKG